MTQNQIWQKNTKPVKFCSPGTSRRLPEKASWAMRLRFHLSFQGAFFPLPGCSLSCQEFFSYSDFCPMWMSGLALKPIALKEHRGSPNNWASGNGCLNWICFSNERLTSVTSFTHSFRDLSSSGFLMWRVSSGRKVFLEFCWGRRANAASIYRVCQKSQKQKWSPVQESTS